MFLALTSTNYSQYIGCDPTKKEETKIIHL